LWVRGLVMGEHEGKHRGAPAGEWMAYEPKHRAPGGEMSAVGYVLVPLGDADPEPDQGAYDVCERCGQAINDYADGRGLVVMVTGNPECYGR